MNHNCLRNSYKTMPLSTLHREISMLVNNVINWPHGYLPGITSVRMSVFQWRKTVDFEQMSATCICSCSHFPGPIITGLTVNSFPGISIYSCHFVFTLKRCKKTFHLILKCFCLARVICMKIWKKWHSCDLACVSMYLTALEESCEEGDHMVRV